MDLSTRGIYRPPTSVERLYRREKQIALIVYDRGLSTAVDVQRSLPVQLSNASIRSMLNRLVRKGVLTRLECERGGYLYGPAVNEQFARELEVRQFAADFFGGSLDRLAAALGALVTKEHARAPAERTREGAPAPSFSTQSAPSGAGAGQTPGEVTTAANSGVTVAAAERWQAGSERRKDADGS